MQGSRPKSWSAAPAACYKRNAQKASAAGGGPPVDAPRPAAVETDGSEPCSRGGEAELPAPVRGPRHPGRPDRRRQLPPVPRPSSSRTTASSRRYATSTGCRTRSSRTHASSRRGSTLPSGRRRPRRPRRLRTPTWRTRSVPTRASPRTCAASSQRTRSSTRRRRRPRTTRSSSPSREAGPRSQPQCHNR